MNTQKEWHYAKIIWKMVRNKETFSNDGHGLARHLEQTKRTSRNEMYQKNAQRRKKEFSIKLWKNGVSLCQFKSDQIKSSGFRLKAETFNRISSSNTPTQRLQWYFFLLSIERTQIQFWSSRVPLFHCCISSWFMARPVFQSRLFGKWRLLSSN